MVRVYIAVCILLSLVLLFPLSTSEKGEKETFVPGDIGHAVAMGCVVWSDVGPPPFAEAQAFVKYSNSSKAWDWKPIIGRYQREQGGIFAANQDCIQWHKDMERTLKDFLKESQKAKKP